MDSDEDLDDLSEILGEPLRKTSPNTSQFTPSHAPHLAGIQHGLRPPIPQPSLPFGSSFRPFANMSSQPDNKNPVQRHPVTSQRFILQPGDMIVQPITMTTSTGVMMAGAPGIRGTFRGQAPPLTGGARLLVPAPPPAPVPPSSAVFTVSSDAFAALQVPKTRRNSLLSGGSIISSQVAAPAPSARVVPSTAPLRRKALPLQPPQPMIMRPVAPAASGSKQYRNIQPKPPPLIPIPATFTWTGPPTPRPVTSQASSRMSVPIKGPLPGSPQYSPRTLSVPLTEPPGAVPLCIPHVPKSSVLKTSHETVVYSQGGVQDLSRKSTDVVLRVDTDDQPINLTMKSPTLKQEETADQTPKSKPAESTSPSVSTQSPTNQSAIKEEKTVPESEVKKEVLELVKSVAPASPVAQVESSNQNSGTIEENSSGLLRTVSCNEDQIPVVYDEAEFVWEDYLEATNATAAPPTAFKHVECSLRTAFEKGMKLEVPNRDQEGTYWVASVVMACGQLLRLRHEGFEGSSGDDFWLDACTSDIHPIGWCNVNGKTLEPPQVVKDRVAEWTMLRDDLLSKCDMSSEKFSETRAGVAAIDQIKPDTWLEVQHPLDPHCVWLARVAQNVGGRLLLEYAGVPSPVPFWLFYLNLRLHPIGWASERGYHYRPPDSIAKCFESEDQWKSELNKCMQKAELKPFPPHLFEDQEMPGAHDLQEGWKLEVINPRTFASLHPATVTKVIDELYFIVTLDDLSPNHEEVQFCCHGASPGIFPICWSMYKGLKLVPPKGWTKPDFDWKEYLAETNGEAAPEKAFNNLEIPEHEFKRGMKLEVVDPLQPSEICAGTITRILDQLLWLHLDSSNKQLANHIVHIESHDIFPIGWCDSNNYPLRPPKRSSYKKSSKKVAIVQPEKHMSADEYRSATYTQIKQAGEGSGWCPKIYFNHRCFSGAFLSKGRIAELPRCVGPGPVLLVMKEVLRLLINVAYKSSRVLRELQLEGEPRPNMAQQVLKAKYKGKSYRAKVEICKTRDQVEEFCRQICIKLECCPNLFSLVHVGDHCPSNCWQLTKTKYSNYFGKKKRRIGRPPGGHSNLEFGPKRPGGRRGRRRGTSIFSRQRSSNEGLEDVPKDDNESVISMETNSSCSTTEKGEGEVEGVVPKRKYQKRVASAPLEMKTRGVKLPRYSYELKPLGRGSAVVSPLEPPKGERRRGRPPKHEAAAKAAAAAAAAAAAQSSTCDATENRLSLASNPLHWTVAEVMDFMKGTDCVNLVRIFQDQEIDGQALLLLSLPTIQEHLELKLGPAIKLCHQIERIKIAFYEHWAD